MTQSPSQSPTIFLETPREGVRLIRLSRPAQRNALTRDMVDEFHQALDVVESDPSCRVSVITGDGVGFCSGQDMQAANARNLAGGARISERLHWQKRFADMAGRIRAMPKPFIAAVNGAAAGAGMAIALGCDIRLATPAACFLVASVRIGLSGGESGLSYLLPRLIGASRAFDLLLTGRPLDAAEAERIGLVSAIVDPSLLLDTALERCAMIIANSPFAVAQTKQLMWANLDAGYSEAVAGENRAQILATQTADYREATRAFIENACPCLRVNSYDGPLELTKGRLLF